LLKENWGHVLVLENASGELMKDALPGIGKESDWANLKFSEAISGYPREIELRKSVGLKLRRQRSNPRVRRDGPDSPLRAFRITIAAFTELTRDLLSGQGVKAASIYIPDKTVNQTIATFPRRGHAELSVIGSTDLHDRKTKSP
jgi:hypothetical protein